ncbi:MAG: hypothetical protein DRJ01_04620 [Bacteroidetes bacterium]|nr:MAG: hypothetical protein DRJ01_04620 [Bacteroidota bacterium]
MKSFFRFTIPLFFIITVFSCNKEKIITSPDAKLNFSTDTVTFDTVFTTIGSTTKKFKVYNNNKSRISISSIRLANGDDSNFRINLNGVSANYFTDIEIPSNDSIFVFVEVNVDPNGKNIPLLIQDSLVFITNGNTQDIDFVAFGQDVHLINGQIIPVNANDTVWTNDKPYLIYNSMLVDSLKTLTIEAGAQLYFHKNSNLLVKGTLIVNGTLEEPVVFQGDRLEELYDNIPGQWGAIALIPGSQGNIINYAIIKNGVLGIQVGEYNVSSPDLTITNTKIQNMTFGGIYAFNSTINASNNIIANCGYYAVSLLVGGTYDFNHCTIANYYGSYSSYSSRTEPSLVISNSISVGEISYVGDLDANFGNCIIYGNNNNEIGIGDTTSLTIFNYKFDHCLIRVDKDFDTSDESHFQNIIKGFTPNFPEFVSTDNDTLDFQLDSVSPAIDFGSIEIAKKFPLDYNQQSRLNDAGPDLGAYEYVE